MKELILVFLLIRLLMEFSLIKIAMHKIIFLVMLNVLYTNTYWSLKFRSLIIVLAYISKKKLPEKKIKNANAIQNILNSYKGVCTSYFIFSKKK